MHYSRAVLGLNVIATVWSTYNFLSFFPKFFSGGVGTWGGAVYFFYVFYFGALAVFYLFILAVITTYTTCFLPGGNVFRDDGGSDDSTGSENENDSTRNTDESFSGEDDEAGRYYF